ncbi:MAG: penicillin-binding protein activator LpoB [Elusimicrobiota bacterium]|nr:penicillin-binding protein activator LpoB [Endomicrobiia bacterium]MDW8165185.1 penicillin-binding protein activator LpoB [Elusimicrobiota bacterium]
MKNLIYFTAIFILLNSCATTPTVTRIDVSEQIDLSGEWNDTDSQLVAAEMIKDALARPWIDEFISAKRQKPRIIVGTVKNRSHEHINTQTFVKDLERELINSGRVIFVASKEERQEIREEKLDQMMHASAATRKQLGEEWGADFILQGQINTIIDQAGNKTVKYYQVELELVKILTNEKVWIGQKKIKKLVERPRTRF